MKKVLISTVAILLVIICLVFVGCNEKTQKNYYNDLIELAKEKGTSSSNGYILEYTSGDTLGQIIYRKDGKIEFAYEHEISSFCFIVRMTFNLGSKTQSFQFYMTEDITRNGASVTGTIDTSSFSPNNRSLKTINIEENYFPSGINVKDYASRYVAAMLATMQLVLINFDADFRMENLGFSSFS